MQILVVQNDWKCLILGTDTENMYPIFELGDPHVRVHPSFHLYLLSYYCPMNPSYTNMLNHYLYLAVKDRKSANPFVGHVLSDEWNPNYYEKETSFAVQPKEKDVKTNEQLLKREHSSSLLWEKELKSQRIMPKPFKMRSVFK